MFSERPPVCLGSIAAAIQPGELSDDILQNLFHNLPPQTVLYVVEIGIDSWRYGANSCRDSYETV